MHGASRALRFPKNDLVWRAQAIVDKGTQHLLAIADRGGMETDASGFGELAWLVVLDEVYPGMWDDLALTLRVATSIFDELAAPAPSVPMLYALVAVWQRCEPRMRARASRRFRETIVAMAIEEPDLPPVFWRRAPRVLAWLRIAEERRLFCASA